MICVCYKHSVVTHTFPESPVLKRGNNSVTNKHHQGLFSFFLSFFLRVCVISVVSGRWFFFCIVLETASLGNWESQIADEMSPHELSSPFTHSQADTLVIQHTFSFSYFSMHTQFLASLIKSLSS